MAQHSGWYVGWLGWRLRIPYVHRAPPFSVSAAAPDCDRASLGCYRQAIWTIHGDDIIAEQICKLSVGRKDGFMTRPSDPKSGNLQAALHVFAQGGFANDRRKSRWQNDSIVCPKRKDAFATQSSATVECGAAPAW